MLANLLDHYVKRFLTGSSQYRSEGKTLVARDAEDLIRLWGRGARSRAIDLSSREDLGFIASPRPGHWWSVLCEIDRRLGLEETTPAILEPAHGPAARVAPEAVR